MNSPLQYLLAEKETVRQFLERTPSNARLVRNSWLSRLAAIDAEIEVEQNKFKPARAAITYKGRPVVGSHGIASTFGLAATRAYTKFVQQLAAQTYRTTPLGTRGVVAGSREMDLLVVGPAYGSFGFTLEEQFDGQTTLEEKTPIANALEVAQSLLQGTTQIDDELTKVVAGVDPRAITSLRTFLTILSKNDAVCAIETEESRFHFDVVSDVNRSLVRLERKNIQRTNEKLQGQFVGMLPTARTFEFVIETTGEKIYGKLDRSVEDNDPINNHLNQDVSIQVISQRVGNGRPYYVLIEAPVWLR